MTKSFAFESRVPIIKKRIFPQKITDLTIYPYEKMLLLILSSVCPFFSCVGDRTVSETMDRSEILLEANPDSSYTLLNKIETPDRLNERQFARWCMLYCRAADKLSEICYIPNNSTGHCLGSKIMVRWKNRLGWGFT